jgi:hypothetical protein
MTALPEDARRRLALFADPRSLRRRWLATLSRSADWYLRSPIFLVAMRYGLAAAIKAESVRANGFTRLLPRWLYRPAASDKAPESQAHPLPLRRAAARTQAILRSVQSASAPR